MIIAELVPENGFVFLRFVEPGENASKKPYIPLNSMEEAERRISFTSRLYIIEKLTAWLKQRAEALPAHKERINMYQAWVYDVRLTGLSYVCDFVDRRRQHFENIAPTEKSQCYPYYKSHILPILNYCSKYKEIINGHAQH